MSEQEAGTGAEAGQETAPALESTATPERQTEAEAMGWIPPARFKGEADGFVDAEEYITKGETIIPIIRKQNQRMHTDMAGMQTKLTEAEAALTAANTRLDDIDERHSVDKFKAVEAAKKTLLAELAVANEAGDHAGAASITGELIELSAQPAEAVKKVEPATETQPVVAPMHPEQTAWMAENTWFGPDKPKTNYAFGVADMLRANGETAINGAFFALISAEMDKVFGTAEPRVDKVEGARNGTGGDTRVNAAGGKAFANLPADAQAHCKTEARTFVGEGKKFKTLAEWQTEFTRLYFEAD